MLAEIRDGKLHIEKMVLPVDEIRGVEAKRNGLWITSLVMVAIFIFLLLAELGEKMKGESSPHVSVGFLIVGAIMERFSWSVVLHTVHQTYQWKTSKKQAQQASRNITYVLK